MKTLIKTITWVIRTLKKIRTWIHSKGIDVDLEGVDIEDVLDMKNANFNGKVTVSGEEEDLDVEYHVKDGKLTMEYIKHK